MTPALERAPRMSRKPVWAPYLFVALAAIYLLVFSGLPLLRGLQLSFTNTKLLNPNGGKTVGLSNYEKLVTGDLLWPAIFTTLVYTALVVVFSLLLGTAAAVVINRAFPGRVLARAMLTLPWAVPTVAVALAFRWMYNESNGVVNDLTQVVGLGQHGWLTDPQFGMFSVVLATVWKVTPFVMLVVLAALQSVPDELYEATEIDGADAFSAFKAVVLPTIAPTLRVIALLMTIWSFRRFEIIWLLTGGGPADATNTIVISIYRQAFQNSQLGLAAALGMIGLLVSLVVTIVYFIVERRAARAAEGL